MAIRVFRVAVVGCPRLVITADPTFSGVGKSCLCNRFVRPEAYTEAHDSTVSADNWTEKPAYNGDHFLYWGAASKYLGEGAKVRFQVIEQTEFCELVGSGLQHLRAHPSDQDYLQRASSVRVVSQSSSKRAYQTHPEGAYASSAASSTYTVRSTQLFPNEDFGSGKGQGVSAYICVFDPTLVGEEMTRQRDFLAGLLQLVSKTKKRIVLACVKCDAVDEGKRKLCSALANSVLKKPIPYVETSAREGINVDEAFFVAATGSVRKRRGVAGKHSSSSPLTYKEGADAKKQDVNQARDAYRRLLTRKVTHFSCLWNDILPVLEVEPEYNHLLRIGGEEAKEMVKKMFCMRLIELKIKEGNDQLKLNTLRKKLDNGQQKAFQSYLSDAFKQHPDMGPDFLTECIPSGCSTPSYTVHNQILENGGQHLSTPNETIGAAGAFHFSHSRSNMNPSPLPLTPIEGLSESYDQLQLPSSWSSRVSPATSSFSSMVLAGSPVVPAGSQVAPTGSQTVPAGSPMASSSSLAQKRTSQQVFASGSPVLQRRAISTLIVASPVRQVGQGNSPTSSDRQPPPVPSRNSIPLDAQSNGSISGVTMAAPSALVPLNDTAARRNTRSFSNSVDCLLGPLPPEPETELDIHSETASEANTADVQPYLDPRDLGLIPPPPPPPSSIAPSPPPRSRGANQFRSLRMIKHQPRPQLPDKMSAAGDISRTLSLRGYKRSLSNPGLLDSTDGRMTQALPAHLRSATGLMNGDGGHLVSFAATSSSGNNPIPIQSSSDFAHSEFQRLPPTTDSSDGAGDRGANCMDPTGGNGNDQSSDDEDDNQSELSGPFEEIDERPPVQEGGGGGGGTLEATSINTPNHYAMIEDYVTMRSAEPVVGEGSPPSASQGNQTSPQHDTSASPSSLEHNTSSSSLRPLPPSPEKQEHAKAGKSSSSNIYEVIDESWAGKQLRGGGTGWASTVDPSHFHLYEQVVKEFFRDPEVTQHWWNAVRKVIPTGDMTAFPPPFFQAPPLSVQGRGDTQLHGGVPLHTVTESDAKMTSPALAEGEPEEEPEPGHLGMMGSMARSRDDMIGFINQQLNQSLHSDSDDDQSDEREEDDRGEFTDSESDDPETGSCLEAHSGSSTSIPIVCTTIPMDSAIPNTAAALPSTASKTTTSPHKVPSSLTPLFSSSASPSPSLSPPRDVPERPLDCPQVSEKQKKTILGVGWCTDLDLMNGCDKLNDVAAKYQTGISTFQSHALEAHDSESEC